MRLRPALLVLLAAVAWGCASAEGAYTDGMALETAGDYAGAADAYVTALERDRALPNVAGRLAVAGREAVRTYVAEADALDAEGAARAYLDAQALVDRAAAVGVDLERPASFAADRDAALAAAVDDLLAQAEDRRASDDFAGAIARVGRARAFRPSPASAAALDALALDVYGAWAEADLAAGRYRSALAHADAALGLGPTGAPLASFGDLRGAILDAGRVVAAVFPVEGGGDLPDRVLLDLYDVLVEDRLAGAGPFIAITDPADVRRWDRERRRGPALADSPRRLADATADLGADLGVVVVLNDVAEQETAGQPRTERARVRGSQVQAAYTLREVDLALTAEADVVVVEAASGRAVCDDAVRQRASASYDRGAYDGDWRELELSRGDRAAFADDAADRAYSEALTDLRDALADALAQRVIRCLDARVP